MQVPDRLAEPLLGATVTGFDVREFRGNRSCSAVLRGAKPQRVQAIEFTRVRVSPFPPSNHHGWDAEPRRDGVPSSAFPLNLSP